LRWVMRKRMNSKGNAGGDLNKGHSEWKTPQCGNPKRGKKKSGEKWSPICL